MSQSPDGVTTSPPFPQQVGILGVVLSIHYVEPRVEPGHQAWQQTPLSTKPSGCSLLLSGSSLPPTCRLLFFLPEGSLYITSLGQPMLPSSVTTYWPSRTTGSTQSVSSSPSELNLKCNQEAWLSNVPVYQLHSVSYTVPQSLRPWEQGQMHRFLAPNAHPSAWHQFPTLEPVSSRP